MTTPAKTGSSQAHRKTKRYDPDRKEWYNDCSCARKDCDR